MGLQRNSFQLEKSGPGEFSRILDLKHLPTHKRFKVKSTASELECAALSRRFNILNISDLKVDLNISYEDQESQVHVSGILQADIEQQCVISLEPVKGHVESAFSFRCLPKSILDKMDEEAYEDEIIEPIVDGKVDLGEVISQLLALELDPYPKARNAALKGENIDFGLNEIQKNRQKPFENLSHLLKSSPK